MIKHLSKSNARVPETDIEREQRIAQVAGASGIPERQLRAIDESGHRVCLLDGEAAFTYRYQQGQDIKEEIVTFGPGPLAATSAFFGGRMKCV